MDDDLWVRYVYKVGAKGDMWDAVTRQRAQQAINSVPVHDNGPIALEVLNTGERFYPETPKHHFVPMVQGVCGTCGELSSHPNHPPTPAPERVGSVAKRVRDTWALASKEMAECDWPQRKDLWRLLACAEASDAVEQESNVADRYYTKLGAAWRRTVTGEP